MILYSFEDATMGYSYRSMPPYPEQCQETEEDLILEQALLANAAGDPSDDSDQNDEGEEYESSSTNNDESDNAEEDTPANHMAFRQNNAHPAPLSNTSNNVRYPAHFSITYSPCP